MNHNELYKQVTADIVLQLKEGTVPWIKPWTVDYTGSIFPENAVTCQRYRGANVPILWNAAMKNKYPSHSWLTYRQATENGGHVKKGQKSTTVIFTRWIKKEIDGTEETRPMVRTYSVFNIAQCEGLPEKFQPLPDVSSLDERLDRADQFCASTNAEIIHGGDKACYIPSEDYIRLPNSSDFNSHESYYSALLHELTHWTGHSSRLKRSLCGNFGSIDYAEEELVAELGAAMLCAYLNIQGNIQHASYIQNWIDILDNDHRALFKASSYASQACDWIIEAAEHTEHDEAA